MLVYFYKKRGALTNKTYSFSIRAWEFESFPFFNVFDSFLERVSWQFANNKIVVITPFNKKASLFAPWILDAVRFSVDGFFLNRLLKNFFFKSSGYINVFAHFNVQFFIFYFVFLKIYLKLLILLYVFKVLNDFFFYLLLFSVFAIKIFFNDFLDIKQFFFFNVFYVFYGFRFIVNCKGESKTNLILQDWFSSFLLDFKNDFNVNLKIIIFGGFEPRFTVPLLNMTFRKFFLYSSTFFFYIGNCSFSNFGLLNLGITFEKSFFFSRFNRLLNLFLLNANQVKILFNPASVPEIFFFKFLKFKISLVFTALISITIKTKFFLQNLNYKLLTAIDLKKNEIVSILNYFDCLYFTLTKTLKICFFNKFFISFFFGSHGLFFYYFNFNFLKYDVFICTNLFNEFLNVFINNKGKQNHILLLNFNNFFSFSFIFYFFVIFSNFFNEQIFFYFLFFRYLVILFKFKKFVLRINFLFIFKFKIVYFFDFFRCYQLTNYIFSASRLLLVFSSLFVKQFSNYQYLFFLC